MTKFSTLCVMGLAITTAHAQFTGPAPLSWRWSQPTSVAPGGMLGTTDDRLFVASGNRVYSVNRLSGNQLWRFPAAEPLAASFRTGVVMADDLVIAAADDKTIYGLDAATGQSRWTYRAANGLIGAPIRVGKYVVFAMSDSTLMALYLNNGQPAWMAPQRVLNGIQGFISSYLDNIIVCTQRQELWSVNVGSQNKVWSQQFSILGGDIKPTVFGDSVYINTGTFVVSLSAIDGRKRWQADAQMPLLRNPGVSSRGVVVTSRDGMAMTFDLNGRRLFKNPVSFGSPPIADPAFTGTVVSIPSQNGTITMLDGTSGDLVWSYTIPPLAGTSKATTTTTSSGGGGTSPGDGGAGPGAGGRRGGGPSGGGPSGGGPGAGAAADNKPITFIQPASAPLLVGDSLLIVARDGSILNFDKTTGVDLTPPSVKMLFPNPGDMVNAAPPFDVYFQVVDLASGVNTKTLKVEVDGQKLESTYTKENYLVVKFTYGGKNPQLQDGRHVFKITAADWLGNVAEREFSLVMDSTLPKSKPANKDNNGTSPGGGRPGNVGGEG